MKLALNVNVPDYDEGENNNQADNEGDSSSSYNNILNFINKNKSNFESVLEKELLNLFPEAENYNNSEISLTFLTPEEIRSLNKEYRNIDESTDVLSFPIYDPVNDPEEFNFNKFFDLLALGDIVICPEEVKRLHPELNLKEALCLMIAHSFLHLLGWDHDTQEKESKMWELQEIIKNKFLENLIASEELI